MPHWSSMNAAALTFGSLRAGELTAISAWMNATKGRATMATWSACSACMSARVTLPPFAVLASSTSWMRAMRNPRSSHS